ncbi:cytidine/deoxycytidylate deaminase family protein [bacterium]|nr:cytidine/deoxycytidylate deaminase family protein [candidate division CSSED10-310 bacterium]
MRTGSIDVNIRPSWDEYFMEIVYLIAKRSTCLRRKVGAVIVKDNRILATGYNGVPAGIRHCDECGGCLRSRLNVPSGERHELCRGLHAEQNAIIQAAFHGTSVKGSTLYCTTMPCIVCAKMIINAGIQKIIYAELYDDPLALEMLNESGIRMERFFHSTVHTENCP